MEDSWPYVSIFSILDSLHGPEATPVQKKRKRKVRLPVSQHVSGDACALRVFVL
jgi:hypothetical protein